MKKFIKKICIFILPVVVLVLFVNWYGDAAHLFFKSGLEEEIAILLTQGYNIENVQNIDERALQRNIVKHLMNIPEIIVLGSSRVMLLGSEYSDTSLFNHGVSGCSIEDILAIWQMYKNRGELPKKVIIGLDPWIFNRNNGQNRWKSIKIEYESFLGVKHYNDYVLQVYSQLLSPTYFQASLRNLIKAILIEEANSSSIIRRVTMSNYGEGPVLFKDGTRIPNLSRRERSISEYNKHISNYIENGYSLENFTSFSEDYVDMFAILISELVSEGIVVEFVIAPFAPRAFDNLKSNRKYEMALKFEIFVKRFAKDNGMSIYGSLDPLAYELTSDDFRDAMHLNSGGFSKLLRGVKY
jgi:hypothetical protein